MADQGHKETDELLEELEEKLKKEYGQAVKETQAKLDKYMERFEAKDKKWRDDVASGKKTEDEYQKWRTGQIMIGQRWEEMRDTLAQDYHNANVIARSIVDGYTPDVYALNHNYATFEVESGSMLDTSYTLYDRQTVERLLRDNPDLLPQPGKDIESKSGANKDIRWQEGQIQSVTLQSILQGESIPNMAKRICREMGEENYANAVRYARTAVTGAENAGRIDAYHRAQSLGIELMKTWVSTLDGRTRHTHVEIDGETVAVDDVFSNGCEYPGDSSGPPAEVWNCRCTTIAQVKGFETDVTDTSLRYDENLGDMSYDEWKESREDQAVIPTLNGLNKPERPKKEEYDSVLDYEKARIRYRIDSAKYERKIEKWIKTSTPKKSMTVEEFKDWCDKAGVLVYNDVSRVDGKAFTLFTDRMDKLFKDFPIVQEYAKNWIYGGKFNVMFEDTNDYIAEASTGFSFGGMFTNLRYVLEDQALAVTTGVRCVGDGTINQVFDHEFGHSIYNAILYADGNDTKERIGIRTDLIASLSGRTGASEYSEVNDAELFAEAFSAWYGGETTDFANAMGDFLRRRGII